MKTFNLIQDAKKEASVYSAFWQIEKPTFKIEGVSHSITEQWRIEQNYGIKAEGSFTLL